MLDETNTGSSQTLQEFMAWGLDKHPASHKMLILSGHGSGVVEDFLAADYASGDSLTVDELVTALESQPKLDIIGMDTCLMSMGEVMFALGDKADYFVGAEGFEPQGGWPYRRLFEVLLPRAATIGPEGLAKEIVKIYVNHYRPLTELGRTGMPAKVALNAPDRLPQAKPAGPRLPAPALLAPPMERIPAANTRPGDSG